MENEKKRIGTILIIFVISTLVYKYKEKFYKKESRADSDFVSSFKKDLNLQTPNGSLSRIDWISEMGKKYKQINKKINDVCQNKSEQDKVTFNKHKRLSKREFYGGFMHGNWMLNIDHKMAYCNHPKVATMTWISHFFDLTDYSIKQDVQKSFGLNPNVSEQLNRMLYIRSFTEEKYRIPVNLIFPVKETKNIRNKKKTKNVIARYLISFWTNVMNLFFQNTNVLTFSFVRHPFERLVSAYKNKFLNGKITTVSKRYKKKIATFPEFIDLVMQQFRAQEECRDLPNKYICANIDAHWDLFNHRCLYCDIQYDVIGKIESFNDDIKYIVLKQKLEELIPLNTTNLHLNDKKEYASNSTLYYFSQLSKFQKDRLYEFYKFDFELFDYNVEIYLN